MLTDTLMGLSEDSPSPCSNDDCVAMRQNAQDLAQMMAEVCARADGEQAKLERDSLKNLVAEKESYIGTLTDDKRRLEREINQLKMEKQAVENKHVDLQVSISSLQHRADQAESFEARANQFEQKLDEQAHELHTATLKLRSVQEKYKQAIDLAKTKVDEAQRAEKKLSKLVDQVKSLQTQITLRKAKPGPYLLQFAQDCCDLLEANNLMNQKLRARLRRFRNGSSTGEDSEHRADDDVDDELVEELENLVAVPGVQQRTLAKTEPKKVKTLGRGKSSKPPSADLVAQAHAQLKRRYPHNEEPEKVEDDFVCDCSAAKQPYSERLLEERDGLISPLPEDSRTAQSWKQKFAKDNVASSSSPAPVAAPSKQQAISLERVGKQPADELKKNTNEAADSPPVFPTAPIAVPSKPQAISESPVVSSSEPTTDGQNAPTTEVSKLRTRRKSPETMALPPTQQKNTVDDAVVNQSVQPQKDKENPLNDSIGDLASLASMDTELNESLEEDAPLVIDMDVEDTEPVMEMMEEDTETAAPAESALSAQSQSPIRSPITSAAEAVTEQKQASDITTNEDTKNSDEPSQSLPLEKSPVKRGRGRPRKNSVSVAVGGVGGTTPAKPTAADKSLKTPADNSLKTPADNSLKTPASEKSVKPRATRLTSLVHPNSEKPKKVTTFARAAAESIRSVSIGAINPKLTTARQVKKPQKELKADLLLTGALDRAVSGIPVEAVILEMTKGLREMKTPELASGICNYIGRLDSGDLWPGLVNATQRVPTPYLSVKEKHLFTLIDQLTAEQQWTDLIWQLGRLLMIETLRRKDPTTVRFGRDVRCSAACLYYAARENPQAPILFRTLLEQVVSRSATDLAVPAVCFMAVVWPQQFGPIFVDDDALLVRQLLVAHIAVSTIKNKRAVVNVLRRVNENTVAALPTEPQDSVAEWLHPKMLSLRALGNALMVVRDNAGVSVRRSTEAVDLERTILLLWSVATSSKLLLPARKIFTFGQLLMEGQHWCETLLETSAVELVVQHSTLLMLCGQMAALSLDLPLKYEIALLLETAVRARRRLVAIDAAARTDADEIALFGLDQFLTTLAGQASSLNDV